MVEPLTKVNAAIAAPNRTGIGRGSPAIEALEGQE